MFLCFCFVFVQGVIEDRIGYFPAAFAHLLRAGDRVFRCNRTFIGCKEQGQITLKEGQVLYKLNDEGTLGQWLYEHLLQLWRCSTQCKTQAAKSYPGNIQMKPICLEGMWLWYILSNTYDMNVCLYRNPGESWCSVVWLTAHSCQGMHCRVHPDLWTQSGSQTGLSLLYS